MKQFEYFQETVETISDDAWLLTLKKHGGQGWELCSIALKEVYIKQEWLITDEHKQENDAHMQTLYIVVFKREL